MSRTSRTVSSADIYHIIIRGSGKQIIFEDDSDRFLFLRLLGKYFEELGGELFAWILMSNHVHVIARMPLEDVATLMRKLGATYFSRFNKKNEHVGPVLQGRYKSEAINTDEYLMTCVRYVHQNIEKAGSGKMEEYPWSSYCLYTRSDSTCSFLQTETDFVLAVFGGIENFKGFHAVRDYAVDCIDIEKSGSRMSDDEALIVARSLLGEDAMSHVKELDVPQRDTAIRMLKEKGRLSIRQVARLTGLGVKIVRNA